MIDTDIYRRILEQCFPNLSIESIQFIGGGSFRVFEVRVATLPETRLIFRFPHGREGSDLLRQEQRVCDWLQPVMPFPIPLYMYRSEGCPLFQYPVGGYHRLRGIPLQECELAPRALSQAAEQLGTFLSALHSMPPTAMQVAASPSLSAAASRSVQRAFYRNIRTWVFPQLNSSAQAWTRNLFESYLAEDAHWSYRPVLIHGDFDSSNILYDPDQGKVAGVIDFEDAGPGDPAWDFCALAAEYGTEFVQRLSWAYDRPLDTGFWQRVAFHSRRIIFHELLYGIQEDEPACFDHGRIRLQRAMEGLEPIGGWLATSTSETRQWEGFPDGSRAANGQGRDRG